MGLAQGKLKISFGMMPSLARLIRGFLASYGDLYEDRQQPWQSEHLQPCQERWDVGCQPLETINPREL
jgi:hypothetical protein